jgi:predicted amidohydrolase YtcJ
MVVKSSEIHPASQQVDCILSSHDTELTNNFTGVFVDNAMAIVRAPAWSFEKRASYLELATQDALKYGLTSVHDAASTSDIIEVFQR